MKQSCLILLQTVPDKLDIESFTKDFMKTFPDVVSLHDVHIWQLTSNKCVSTAHIVFKDIKVIKKTCTYFKLIIKCPCLPT